MATAISWSLSGLRRVKKGGVSSAVNRKETGLSLYYLSVSQTRILARFRAYDSGYAWNRI